MASETTKNADREWARWTYPRRFQWDKRRPRWWDGIEAWLKNHIAEWLAGDRNRGECYVTFKLWAMDGDAPWRQLFTGELFETGDGRSCHGEAAGASMCGSCWCGKFCSRRMPATAGVRHGS